MAVGLWFSANYALMIAPVWDEINFYVLFSPFKKNVWQGFHFLWFEYGLYRPLATTFLAVNLSVFSPDLVWPLLRIFNAVMVIASYWLIAGAAKAWHSTSYNGLSKGTLLNYWFAGLLAPTVLIVSNWFANIFDASCLLFIALGLSAWTRNRPILAGSMFGLAWFCKEAAIFAMPLLIYLYVINPPLRKNTSQATAIYMALGLVYWLLRYRIILLLGPAAAIHPLNFSRIFAALPAAAIRLSLPGLTVLPSALGFTITLLLALSARSAVFFGYVSSIILCAALVYQDSIAFGAIGHQLPLINPAIFDARFFHIPLALLMFGLLLQRQTWPFVLLTLSFLAATPFEFRHYRQFQLAYQSYYQLAAKAHKPIVIFAKASDGVQKTEGAFGVKIGEYPNADYVLNPNDGSLTPTH